MIYLLLQHNKLHGKMKTYSLIVIIFRCCICRYTSVEIMPELKKNILNFVYGINFKYEGMLAHSFDRFYVVTKFILPIINDLKFSAIDFNETCDYLQEKNGCNEDAQEYISDLRIYCKKIIPMFIIIGTKSHLLIIKHIIF